jgi:signal transduction histidine kinase
MGQSSAGQKTMEEASLQITVLAPWWASWWFRTGVLLGFAGLLYALYRYRLQQALRLERVRNRIAQDLHDEIGSTLSSISLYSAVMQQSPEARSENTNAILDKIIQSTSQMMESMNDMVWTIKADNDSFEQVVNRMRAFAVGMTEVKNIQLHFKADELAEKLELNMDQRKNIYLIFKEGINNTIKYSACRNLKVSISAAKNKLELSIEDDGKGFDEAAIENGTLLGGNGLRGMRLRAKQIGGVLSIESAVGKGTRIVFVIRHQT